MAAVDAYPSDIWFRLCLWCAYALILTTIVPTVCMISVTFSRWITLGNVWNWLLFLLYTETDSDDFNFHITNFPFLSSNIPSSPAYRIFISQLTRYARACSSYERFILRAVRLYSKLLGWGYVKERLKSSLRKCYGWYGDLTKNMRVPSPECYTTYLMMTIYSDTIHW